MDIRAAVSEDIKILCRYDKHICREELLNLITLGRVYIAEESGKFIGWMRYNLFWDDTPFMNMLYLLESSRGKGFGREFVNYWEKQMKLLGYNAVMTSTQQEEDSQHFYNKLGYKTVGGFMPYGEAYELILLKDIGA